MILKDISTAIAFISRIPLKSKGNLKKAAVHFPAAGYIAAAIVYGLAQLPLDVLKPYIIIATQYYLFNLFHFDGLLDTADGFLSQHRSAEERLKIIKKPDIGAFAVFTAVIYLIVKVKLISLLLPHFFLYPIGGRLAMLFSLNTKAASNKGLAAMILPIDKKKIILYGIVYVLPVAILFPLATILLVASSVITSLTLSAVAYKKIDGLNGDVIGTICEIEELFYLCLLAFIRY